MHTYTHTHAYSQWKLAPKSDLMDSKLKCTFVNIGPPLAEGVVSNEEPTSTTKANPTYKVYAHWALLLLSIFTFE